MRPLAIFALSFTAAFLIAPGTGCSPAQSNPQGSPGRGAITADTTTGDAGTGDCDGGCAGSCTFRTGVTRTQLDTMSCSDGCGCPVTRTSGDCVARADGCMSEDLLNQLGNPDYRVREAASKQIAACCTDSNYLSWLTSAPQNRSSDPEIVRRLTDAISACWRAIDPCSAVDGGTLTTMANHCVYRFTGIGTQEEPWRSCQGNQSGLDYREVYHATCAVTGAEYADAYPCGGSGYCPAGTQFSSLPVTADGPVHLTLAECENAPYDSTLIQQLLDKCSSEGADTRVDVQIDACRQDWRLLCIP